jgi:ABC-type transporter Mla subunit MlaD
MSSAAGDLEATLCQAFREQATLYDRALSLADSLTASLRRGEDVTDSLGQVVALLGQVSDLEARLAPSWKLWEKRARQPCPELTAVLAEVQGLAQRLSHWVAEAEGEAKAQQQQIVPQLDALIRLREMRRAYGSVQIRSRRGT